LIEVITIAEMYFILNFARDIFYDSDDDEENETVKIAKVEEYAEEIVPRFSDKTFKMHFRITPNTFEVLLIKICNIQNDNNERYVTLNFNLMILAE